MRLTFPALLPCLLIASLAAAPAITFAAAPTAPAVTASTSTAAGPQSFVDGNPQTKNNPQVVAVRVVSVDGNAARENPVQLFPGPHWLEVAGPSSKPGQPSIQSAALRIQPCTYYYLGARKNPLQPGQWKLIVDTEETLVSCSPAAEMKKMQDAAKAAPPKAH